MGQAKQRGSQEERIAQAKARNAAEGIRDVSFCDSREQTIVFVPDDRGFEDAPGKVRHTFIESRQAALAKFDEIDQAMIHRTTAEQAWEMMPSYEQWQAGARSPNMFFEPGLIALEEGGSMPPSSVWRSRALPGRSRRRAPGCVDRNLACL